MFSRCWLSVQPKKHQLELMCHCLTIPTYGSDMPPTINVYVRSSNISTHLLDRVAETSSLCDWVAFKKEKKKMLHFLRFFLVSGHSNQLRTKLNSAIGLPMFGFFFCYFLVLWLWANYITSLCSNFFTCEICL